MYDLIIIGGGPCGLTAGIYSSRAGLKTLIVEKAMPGGQAANTHLIENYPGFPDGIGGWELMQLFTKQAEKWGTTFETAAITGVSANGDIKIVHAENQDFTAKAVLIATGATPKYLGVKGEKEFVGKGVSYCGTCDGPLYRGKEVIVVGGGNTALQEIDFLSRFVDKIHLINRSSEYRAQKALVDKMHKNNKVVQYLNAQVTEIFGSQIIEGVKIDQNGTTKTLPAQGVFIFVGHDPVTDFCKNFLATDERGFLKVNYELECSRPGFFGGGDVITKDFFQVATAVGEGALASHSVEMFLK
ncbi:MAG: FAD-dependent oxidoreductase [Clostridiales bacterium]